MLSFSQSSPIQFLILHVPFRGYLWTRTHIFLIPHEYTSASLKLSKWRIILSQFHQNINREQKKSWVTMYCWHEHNHVKDANVSYSCEWQGLPVIELHALMMNVWSLVNTSLAKNRTAAYSSRMIPWLCPLETVLTRNLLTRLASPPPLSRYI